MALIDTQENTQDLESFEPLGEELSEEEKAPQPIGLDLVPAEYKEMLKSLKGYEVVLSAKATYFKSPLGFMVKYFGNEPREFHDHKTTIVGANDEFIYFHDDNENIEVQVTAMVRYEDVILWDVNREITAVE